MHTWNGRCKCLPCRQLGRKGRYARYIPICATRNSTTSCLRLRDMDADVITIETSRSRMELLNGFGQFKYPNEIGPGVYDIHSPRIPQTEEMWNCWRKRVQVIDPKQLWVNPDCGLKTRTWPETVTALKRMVEAARLLRARLEVSEAESANADSISRAAKQGTGQLAQAVMRAARVAASSPRGLAVSGISRLPSPSARTYQAACSATVFFKGSPAASSEVCSAFIRFVSRWISVFASLNISPVTRNVSSARSPNVLILALWTVTPNSHQHLRDSRQQSGLVARNDRQNVEYAFFI